MDDIQTDSGVEKAEEIRAKVTERIKIEEAMYPDVSLNNGKVDSVFIKMCLDANELGDGVLYTALNKKQFIYNVTADDWMVWNGQYWDYDEHNKHLAAVEIVVDRLLEETTQISEQIDWAIKKKDNSKKSELEALGTSIYKRIARLRTDRGRNPCIKFALSCREPLTIREEE